MFHPPLLVLAAGGARVVGGVVLAPGNAQPDGHALGKVKPEGGTGSVHPDGAEVEGFGAAGGVVDFGLLAGLGAGVGVASSPGPPPTPPTGTGSQPSSD